MFGPPKESEDVECALGELPALLDSREKEISRILIEKTQKQRITIRDLRSSLKELVKDLTSKEREVAYHPNTRNTPHLIRLSIQNGIIFH